MRDDFLVEGSVAAELLEGDDCVEIPHVVWVVGDRVLYVIEELCFLLESGDGVNPFP